MILHYLGLDHIGHLAGPLSPLVAPKLTEMDNIIREITSGLKTKDETENRNSLFVLCGDHGMSDAGSHGGASLAEVLTPLIFLSPGYSNGNGKFVIGHRYS